MIPTLEPYGLQMQAVVRFTPWHITAQDSVRGVGSAGLVGRLGKTVQWQKLCSAGIDFAQTFRKTSWFGSEGRPDHNGASFDGRD